MKGFKGQKARLKPLPTYEDIFERLTSEQIFSNYIPNVQFGTPMRSPLGDSDNVPSFHIFWSRKNKYMFKEHRYGWFGDAIDFVKIFFSHRTQTEACMQICLDFGIEDFHIYDNIQRYSYNSGNQVVYCKPKPRIIVDIQVTVRDWQQYDINFWGQYGITLEWLKYAGIYPIKYFFINGNVKIAEKLAYAYVENKDSKITYKIYQPYAKEIGRKWINNNNSSVWELWNMLPDTHNFLIITKSRKDALSIMATMNIPATSLQAEGTIPKQSVVDELKTRFDYIFLLYDNDFDKNVNYGRAYGEKLSEMFNLPQLELPENFGEKDYSDLVKSHGIHKAKKILWYLIKKELLKHLIERNDNRKENTT